nr:MAG TPA: hypothetical protein [Caudoviricetes sp.]
MQQGRGGCIAVKRYLRSLGCCCTSPTLVHTAFAPCFI